MLWGLLGIAAALADTPATVELPVAPEISQHAASAAPADSPMWSGGSRDQIFGIVGVESEVKAIGSTIADVHLLSAELDWGQLVTTPSKGPKGIETNGFSHSSMTVTRERVVDAELMDTARSIADPDTYDLSDPDERARLCARMPGESRNELDLHTWTTDGVRQGANDLERRGDNPSLLMAENDANRTAMIALRPGESVTLVEVNGDRPRRRAQRRLAIQRSARTLSITEGAAASKVCLEY